MTPRGGSPTELLFSVNRRVLVRVIDDYPIPRVEARVDVFGHRGGRCRHRRCSDTPLDTRSSVSERRRGHAWTDGGMRFCMDTPLPCTGDRTYGGGEPFVVAALFHGRRTVSLYSECHSRHSGGGRCSGRLADGLRLFSRWPAIAAASLTWIWGEATLWNSVREFGFRGVTLLCGLLVILFHAPEIHQDLLDRRRYLPKLDRYWTCCGSGMVVVSRDYLLRHPLRIPTWHGYLQAACRWYTVPSMRGSSP